MEKYTQKQLKALVKDGVAIDITNGTNDTRDEIEAIEGWLDQIGYAVSIYGCGGMLFKGHNTGKLYAITTRSQAIFVFW